MEDPQKLVPKPIKISFVRKPIKTLARDSISKGKPIFQEASCAFRYKNLVPLVLDKKTKKRSRVE